MAKKLTKKQAKEFARIQSGLLIYNCSGSEFEGTDISYEEAEMCYQMMAKQYERLLRDDEHKLGTTQMIINYVREHF